MIVTVSDILKVPTLEEPATSYIVDVPQQEHRHIQ